jgi:hypothetical protein
MKDKGSLGITAHPRPIMRGDQDFRALCPTAVCPIQAIRWLEWDHHSRIPR